MRKAAGVFFLAGSGLLLAVAYSGCAVAKIDPVEEDAGIADTGPTIVCDAANAEGCPCTGTSVDCYEGPKGTANKGICKWGKRSCTSKGVYAKCDSQILPIPETCNGKDDDCDGVIDNVPVEAGVIDNWEDAGVLCYTSGSGVCKYGTYSCGGKDAGPDPICQSFVKPDDRTEECNSIDDNCDGKVDDGLDDMGSCTLSSLKGECAKGSDKCVGGAPVCTQTTFPSSEKCNNKDDNCNGSTDDGATCPYYWQTCYSGYCYCPYVFAYDGKKFAYETTVGGASLIGKAKHLEEGRVIDFQPMWARLDRGAVDYTSGTGVVRTKLIDAEDEIVYFDKAGLTYFETPAGYEVLSSSAIEWNTLKTSDPREFVALRTAAMRTPLAATWMGKKDVTAAISTLDERAVASDEHVANTYELDFGAIKDSSHARIVIDGWKYKGPRNLPDSVAKDAPHLDVRAKDGSWTKAIELATPRGDRKSVSFDLSKVTFPTGKYEVRIFTGTHEDGAAMWFVDRVRLTEEAGLEPAAHVVPIASASLSFMGVPSQLDAQHNDHPRLAIDDGKGELLPEQRTWGAFTRYGDVAPVLGTSDDKLVVMRRGDGVELEFRGLPKAANGNVITVFFETELLFKPRMFAGKTTVITQNVAPLPYHGMGRYPYPAPKQFPNDAEHAQYLRDYQTRVYLPGDTRWGK